MAVRIRLKRIGGKKRPYNRIVICNSKIARDGKVIEKIGSFDASQSPPVVKIDKQRAAYWLKVGAKPTETVADIFKREGISVTG